MYMGTKTKTGKYISERGDTGGGPCQENPITTFDAEVLDIIKAGSVEGHTNVEESATELLFDDTIEIELNEDIHNEFSSAANNTMVSCAASKDVQRVPSVATSLSMQGIVPPSASNSTVTLQPEPSTLNNSVHLQENSTTEKSFPRAPRKKLVYAAAASENYKKSLDQKNEMKSKYYGK
ncbi:hypothetical protein FQA39_LY06831 [Lamprigera yunnana]|nr:hypothetical protein FQA39_LY06831 [Lamprigera yunnana]